MIKVGTLNDLSHLAQIDKDFRIALDGSGNPLYVGFANPGTAESALKWQIMKLTYDGTFTTQPVKGVYANGNDDYIFSWTLKGTYTYI